MVSQRTANILSGIGVSAVVLKILHTLYTNRTSNNKSTSKPSKHTTTTTTTTTTTGTDTDINDNNTNLHETTLYEVGPYTQLDLQQIKDIIENNYNLGTVISYKVLKGGLSNSNYRIDTDTAPYSILLKVCDNKTIDELRTQVQVLVILKQYHIPIAYPIPQPKHISNHSIDSPDRYIIELSNIKPIVLYDYIHGDWVRDPTESMVADVGTALARLHSVPIHKFAGINVPEFPMGLISMVPMLQRINTQNELKKYRRHEFVIFMTQHLKQLQSTITQYESQLPHALCHSDLFVQNIMFSGQNLLAFIDFEELCIAPSLLDVAMTLTGCCYEVDDTLDINLAKSFLSAYTQQRALNPLEVELLPQYLEYSLLAIAAWRFHQFNIVQPDPVRRDSYLSMVRRINTIEPEFLRSLVKQ